MQRHTMPRSHLGHPPPTWRRQLLRNTARRSNLSLLGRDKTQSHVEPTRSANLPAPFVDSGLNAPLSPTPTPRANVPLHLFSAHSCYARRSDWNAPTALPVPGKTGGRCSLMRLGRCLAYGSFRAGSCLCLQTGGRGGGREGGKTETETEG